MDTCCSCTVKLFKARAKYDVTSSGIIIAWILLRSEVPQRLSFSLVLYPEDKKFTNEHFHIEEGHHVHVKYFRTNCRLCKAQVFKISSISQMK